MNTSTKPVHRVTVTLALLVPAVLVAVGCSGASDEPARHEQIDADTDGSADSDAGTVDGSDAGAPGQPSCSIIATNADEGTMTVHCTSGPPETSIACYASAPPGVFMCELGCIRTRDRDCAGGAARAYQCAEGHRPSNCSDAAAADAGTAGQVCCP